MNEARRRRRRRRENRRITPGQARRAIYIDFEGRAVEGEPPVLLGVLWDTDGSGESLSFEQHVFDRSLWPAAERFSLAIGAGACICSDLEVVLDELVDRTEREGRHLVSWSTHDREVIRTWSDNHAFRYRNAIPTARRWRKGRTSLGDGRPTVTFEHQDLQSYLRLIGYEVPEEVRHGAARWIANVRERLATRHGDYETMSPGGKRDWQRLVEHNRHDCFGLRKVVLTATGAGGVE